MKIEKLHVQGYRSLRDVTWEPGDLNVLIGPNGSGKSNLIRVLSLIRNSALGELRNHIIAEGGLTSVLWDKQAKDLFIDLYALFNTKSKDIEAKNFNYRINIKNKTLDLYSIDKEVLSYNYDNNYENSHIYFYKYFDTKWNYYHERDKQGDKEEISDDFTNIHETILSEAGRLGRKIPFYFDQNVYMDMIICNIYNNIDISTNSYIRQDTVSRYEKYLAENAANLVSFLHTHYTENIDFKQNINDAMNAAFNNDFKELVFSPTAESRIQLKIAWKSLKSPIPVTNISEGTLKYLFLISALCDPEMSDLLILEEPELGLHPYMLPIIAEFATEASEKCQVIFTTHSPEFLDAFDGVIPSVTVTENRDGETILRTLHDEDLRYWLEGYSLGNMFRRNELQNMVDR